MSTQTECNKIVSEHMPMSFASAAASGLLDNSPSLLNGASISSNTTEIRLLEDRVRTAIEKKDEVIDSLKDELEVKDAELAAIMKRVSQMK